MKMPDHSSEIIRTYRPRNRDVSIRNLLSDLLSRQQVSMRGNVIPQRPSPHFARLSCYASFLSKPRGKRPPQFSYAKPSYFRPGTPTDNPQIESFSGSFRDECQNMNQFMSLENARDKVVRWQRNYNEFRPHGALTFLTTTEFVGKSGYEAV